MTTTSTSPWADLIGPDQKRFLTSPLAAKTLAMLDVMLPFEILAQHRLNPEARIRHGQECWMAVLHCDGEGKTQFSGGAALMYGGPTYRQELTALVRALAALAHQPGGVTFCGRHWCADHRLCFQAAADAADSPIDWASPAPEPEPAESTFDSRPLETITPVGQVL